MCLSVQVKDRCRFYMFQEDYEEYLQDPKNFSHLAAVPDLLMEAMEEVRASDEGGVGHDEIKN